jgi:hypothetical protein
MPPISTKLHGAVDYATAAALLAAPKLLRGRDPRAATLLRLAGAGTLATSALTDYELGIRRVLPMPVHLVIDAATGSMLTIGGFALRRRGGFSVLLRFALLGGGEIAAAALTARTPADRPAEESMPRATTGPVSTGAAASTSASEGPPLAPAPLETPGPSVTPPEFPQSDVEREERVDANLPASDAPPTDDVLAAQQASAAAAEAAMIGGAVPSESEDPAMDPVYQAGGGEQEGWEATERDLIENATHGDGGANPERDAFTPELESDRSTAVYGESDRISSTEVVEDPAAGQEDPGAGPDLAAERGTDSPPREEPPTRSP